jgi:hypothetical protein
MSLRPVTPQVSRRFSVAAGFYRTCVIDGLLEHSPAEHVRRPAVPPESPTLGFTHLQLPGRHRLGGRVAERRGFGGIEFAKADEPMLIGRDVDDVLEYERTSPTATEILTGLSPAQAARLTRLVRDRVMAYASPDGVTMPGAAWLVSAQAV